MTDRERNGISALAEIFDNNYRITNLYAEYLTRAPEAIRPDMVSALTEDGTLTAKEAVVGLITELFGLDFERSEDRRLIMDYITPSVRILDGKRYTENPYYREIKIENVKAGRWELRREAYEPYRAVICDDMIIREDFSEVPPLGFFTERFEFPAVLEDGNEWMTLTPVDLDTSDYAIMRARGKVVTFGLGLGYFAFMAARKSEVESVTVVEKSPEVIELFKSYILPQIKCNEKIRIVLADAFEYAESVMPREGFDVAFVDTWRDASDGAPMYRKMKALEHLSEGTEFIYWIENFLRSRIRAEKFEELYALAEEGRVALAEIKKEISKI